MCCLGTEVLCTDEVPINNQKSSQTVTSDDQVTAHRYPCYSTPEHEYPTTAIHAPFTLQCTTNFVLKLWI